MKKYIFCLTIMATAFACAPQAASAQNAPLGKGITEAGLKRNDAGQRVSAINILSQAAPGLGLSVEALIDLYEMGAVTISIGSGHPVVVVQKAAKEAKKAENKKR